MERSHTVSMTRRALVAAGAACTAAVAAPLTSKAEGSQLDSGVYRGVADGRAGCIEVEVHVDKGCILGVDVISSSETATISDYAIAAVTSDIVRYQSLEVDTLAGATLTSLGVVNAVRNALVDAGQDVSPLEVAPSYPVADVEDTECDVLVVGAGAAGMMAALQAKAAGKSVLIIEKQGIYGGGDAMLASSGMAGGGGYLVYKLGLEGYSEQDYLDNKTAVAEKSGLPVDMDNLAAYSLMSGEALDYYISIGVPFGKYANFSNTTDDGSSPGTHIIKRLAEQVERKGIECRKNTKLTSIIREGDSVTGVRVSTPDGDYTVMAKAVILACGGFANNEDMLVEYADAGSFVGLPHSGAVSATGEGILAAAEVGADISNMTAIKANNICHVAPNGAVISLAAIQSSAALVNDDGARFIDESGTTINEKSYAELDQPNQEAWAIFDQRLMDAKALLRGYDALGYFECGQTWEELAEAMGLGDEATATFIEQMQLWQGLEEKAEDPLFGGKVINNFSNPPFYAALVKPAMQSTYGGVTTDASAHALDASGTPIPGLYAAGAVSGHGCFGNSVGNGLTIASAFGMIAGRTAAAEIA